MPNYIFFKFRQRACYLIWGNFVQNSKGLKNKIIYLSKERQLYMSSFSYLTHKLHRLGYIVLGVLQFTTKNRHSFLVGNILNYFYFLKGL